MCNAACRPTAVKCLHFCRPVAGFYVSENTAGQDRRARLPGKTAGQDCRARLPGKTAGQDCRARLPDKTAGQVCRARLQGKPSGQGCRAKAAGQGCGARQATFWVMYVLHFGACHWEAVNRSAGRSTLRCLPHWPGMGHLSLNSSNRVFLIPHRLWFHQWKCAILCVGTEHLRTWY
jgi:hypothetical protein